MESNMKIQRGSIFRPDKDYYLVAGIILMVACIQFFLAVTIAETQYPGYSISLNTLSDLALLQPSGTIFNLSIIILGILGLVSVYLILKSGGCRLFSTCLTLSSVGAVGVGLFPIYTGTTHIIFATIAFLFGSLAVIFSYRLGLNIPMTIVSLVLGLISLIAIILFMLLGMQNPLILSLGIGGAERLVAYPPLLYLIALGGYLASRGKDWVRIRFTEGYW
jgi:hypothetical membrane protein